MWKWKEDEKPSATPAPPLATPSASPQLPSQGRSDAAPKEVRTVEAPKLQNNFRTDVAHIGKSVIIKGELSGSEDLYLDGEVEGSIELLGHSLTVGPNGRVRANIQARDVVIHGKVDGNVRGVERVELKKTALLNGDIFTQRIAIEDGAFFKGGIDIVKEAKPEPRQEFRQEPRPEPRREAPPVPVTAAAGVGQAALVEKK